MLSEIERLEERFWNKVCRESDSGCWIWTGPKDEHGYGRFSIFRVPRKASRIAWNLKHGDIPEGVCVLHRCDNPSCVNPEHLFLGTRRDNSLDMATKKRHPWCRGIVKRGEDHPNAILTDALITKIRDLRAGGHSQRGIARAVGVSHTTIRRILSGESWRHVI